MKGVVVNIHAAFAAIGEVQVTLTIDQGTRQAREHRAVGGLDHGYSVGGGRRCSIRQANIGVPCGDRPVERDKDEDGGPPGSIKSVVLPLEMMPVGEPFGVFLLFGSAGGIVTTKDCFVPGPLYRVATPVTLSAAHQTLPEVRVRPHELTNCGSVASAAPDVLA